MKTVVCCEYLAVMRHFYKEFFDAFGLKHFICKNAEEVFSKLTTSDCHMVLYAIDHPEMPGVNFAGELNSRFPDMPLVLVTPEFYSEVENIPSEVLAVSVKPYNKIELIELLKDAFNKHNQIKRTA